MAEGDVSSFLTYSSIGFEKTCTEAFDDLKAEQTSIGTRVTEIVKLYRELNVKVMKGQELDASLRTSMFQYTEAREDVIYALKSWYEKGGRAIAANVDSMAKRRVKRVHDFVESMKRDLRKTEPLKGEEGSSKNHVAAFPKN